MTDDSRFGRGFLTNGGAAVVAGKHTYGERPSHRSPSATHAHAVLAFYTRGESRMEIQGEWTLREGDALLIPAGEPHRLLEERQLEMWGLGFSVPSFAAGNASFLEPFERVRDGASPVVSIPSSRHAYLEGLFGEVERLGRTPQGRRTPLEEVQRSLLTLVLSVIDEAAAGIDTAPRRGSVVGDALRFIERNCLAPLGLEDVARAVGRRPSYVTAALTKATGRSAVQWIVSGRMAEARRLLFHSGERIDDIAARVGYADATHFIRMFRREHGMTPAAWREANVRGERPRARAPRSARH